MSTLKSGPSAARPSRPRRTPSALTVEGPTLAEAEHSLGPVIDFMRTLWAVDHCLFTATRVQRQKLGITGPQRLVLRIVARNPGISPGVLSAVLHLHPSTVTGLVKRLSKRGLLVRRINSQDARRAALTPTTKGMALGLDPGPAEELIERALEVLHPSDVAIAETVMRAVARALAGRPPSRRRAG